MLLKHALNESKRLELFFLIRMGKRMREGQCHYVQTWVEVQLGGVFSPKELL